jgi:hypothetical protein
LKEVEMKRYEKPLGVLACFILLSLLACVTVNIYFPAEKVESVAGEIVDEIRGGKSEGDKESTDRTRDSLLKRALSALSCGVALAEDVTSVSNPTIRALKEQMKSRFAQLKPFYEKGLINEGSDGYVSLGDVGQLDLKNRRQLQNLAEAENKDRKRLYTEVAAALNIDGSQISRIEEIFAKEWAKSVK